MNGKGVFFILLIILSLGTIVAGLILVNVYDGETSKVWSGWSIMMVANFTIWLSVITAANGAVNDTKVKTALGTKQLSDIEDKRKDSLKQRLTIYYPTELFVVLLLFELAMVMVPQTHNYPSSIASYLLIGIVVLVTIGWIAENAKTDFIRIKDIVRIYFDISSSSSSSSK